jgi:type II secretory pathway pseudopilin PulG
VSALAIVLIVLAVLVVLLAAGGSIANARRTRARDALLHQQIQAADRAHAQAHAEDKGWERTTLEAAARDAVAQRFGGVEVKALHLVQVIDRPGTDADQAVFRVETADGDHTVTLGRRDGAWVPA